MPRDRRPQRLKCNYGLPHVQPEPRIEDHVEVWPPTRVINARVVWDTVRLLGPDLLRHPPEYYHFYSDLNYWDLDLDARYGNLASSDGDGRVNFARSASL